MRPVGAKIGGADEATGTLPQAVRRDFSGIDYDEAMRRAREIVPILRERAQRAEDARMLIRENEQLLHESGLFRFHQPKAFGGMELPFVAVVDIPAELARGCASTAWSVGNVACHHWILGYYEPETQREVWEANPDALIASSIALAAGRGRKVPGGSSSMAVGRSLRRSTIRNGTCSRSPSTTMTERHRSIGGCAWCRSPITRSSTPGTPWA
jgi:3-hydroxy-9,10-secoandrosta-1,3,5(10)-triene-9,17-dione monooxygenase